jgi:predicted alpha/beta hydrolase family esterase
MNNKIKVIVIHGNGGSTPKDHWIPYLKRELEKLDISVITPQFPDAYLARAVVWLPFLKHELHANQHTILVGHSSGALAAMRFAEDNKLLGSILVAAMHTDLGIETEQLSDYYNKPWQWENIKKNQQWIAQFASTNDPWIPIAEPRFLQQKLHSEYYEFSNQGHFGSDCDKQEFPELVELIKKKLLL